MIVSSHHEDNPTLENRSFARPGDITISGLFPVHVRSCREKDFRPAYMAMSQAMVYTIERINNDTTLLSNITLGYEIYDSCLTNNRSMETALEIINRRKLTRMFDRYSSVQKCFSKSHDIWQVPALIGSGTSTSSILVANLLQVEDIPLISYAASSDELSKKAYPTFIRTVPPDRFQSQAMADIAYYFNWTYIAAIAADNAYGRSGIGYFKKLISNKRTCLAMEKYFLDGRTDTQEKITRIITELKSLENVHVVVLYCTSKQAKLVLEEANRQNLRKMTWIASEGWGNQNIVKGNNTLPVVKGFLGVVYCDVIVEQFVDYLTSLNSSYRPAHWWENFWESQFNCVFKQTNDSSSIKLCSDDLRITRDTYHTTMHESKSAYVINAVYAIAHALDNMRKCKEPHGLLDGGKCPVFCAPTISPKDLLTYIKAVNFTSPVSRVSFDANGDPSGTYSIINFQRRNGTWEFRRIGSWVSSSNPQLTIDDNIIMWGGDYKGKPPKSVCQEICRPGQWQTPSVGCCWQCISCLLDEISQSFGAANCTKCPSGYISNEDRTECVQVPIVHISYSHPFGLVFIAISCLGVIATIGTTIVFVRHNDSPIVKASNRELCYMLLFCIAMCYLAPFIYLAKPSTHGCILVQVWFYMFYTTCIAILGAKTNKIVLLFEQRVPRSVYASRFFQYRHIMLVASAMLLELVVIIIWVFVDPPRPHINKATREEYFYNCKPSEYKTGEVCQHLLMSILVIASIICCYFAYKARRLPDNFNEGKFIAFSVYILSISWLTFYPVFLNIRDIYSVVVLSVTTFVAASGLLVCMFWPKIYIIIWCPHINTKHYMQEQISKHAFRHNTVKARKRKNLPRPSVTPFTIDGIRNFLKSTHPTIDNTTLGKPSRSAPTTPRETRQVVDVKRRNDRVADPNVEVSRASVHTHL